MGDGAGVAAQERSGQLAYTEWRGVKRERKRSKTIFLLESIPSLPVALILSSLLGHQIPSLKSCCHANGRLQSTRGGLECWRQSCFVSPTSPLCLCGGGTLRVPIAPWNALMCYNLLYYLWKQKRASLCAGRLPCQPCRLVSSSLFLPIWLVLARLPFRCSRPIVTLSRWHLCGWCAALRGSPINIRYTHAGAHTPRLWHTSTFQLTWNTFGGGVLYEWRDAACNICPVIPKDESNQANTGKGGFSARKTWQTGEDRSLSSPWHVSAHLPPFGSAAPPLTWPSSDSQTRSISRVVDSLWRQAFA